MIPTPFYLISQRLIIRPYQSGDFAQYYKKITQSMPRHLTDNRMTDERIANVFEKKIRQPVHVHEFFALAAFDINADDRLVLDMSFAPARREDNAMGIGYYTMKPYRRKGMMTEALRTVLPHLVAKLGVMEVKAVIDPNNIASQKAAQRAGFQRSEGGNIFVYRPRL